MKVKELLALGIIDENQKVVIAHFDGKTEKLFFKNYSHKLDNNTRLLDMNIEENGVGTTILHKDCIYIMVEEPELNSFTNLN